MTWEKNPHKSARKQKEDWHIHTAIHRDIDVNTHAQAHRETGKQHWLSASGQCVNLNTFFSTRTTVGSSSLSDVLSSSLSLSKSVWEECNYHKIKSKIKPIKQKVH